MKTRQLLSVVALGVLLTLLVGPSVAAPVSEVEAGSEQPAELPFDPTEVALASRNAVRAEGDVLAADNDRVSGISRGECLFYAASGRLIELIPRCGGVVG